MIELILEGFISELEVRELGLLVCLDLYLLLY